MAKSSKKDIERDERKVLYELMNDSSQSINDISDKLGFSRQKVWRIIKKLQDEKTVWGYTAIVDSQKLGMKNYILMGKRNAKPLTKELVDVVVSKKLAGLAKSAKCYVENTYYLNGEYDFISTFKAESLIDAKRYQEDFNRLFDGFISKAIILEVLFPLRINGIINPEINSISELL
jgi:DNA-binding Lrp family transcriptional regulator